MLRQLINTFVPQKEETSIVSNKHPEEEFKIPELNYRNLFESMEEGLPAVR